MKPKTRILYIHHGIGIGGAPTSLIKLIQALPKEKYDVKVAFIKPGIAEEFFRENGIKTEVINTTNNWFIHNVSSMVKWYHFYKYLKVFYHWYMTANHWAPEYLKKQSVDIVHLNSHVLTSWAKAASNLGFKVVLHNREAIASGYFGIRKMILKSLIERYTNTIINISRDNKRRLGIEKDSHVVYNFVELPEISRRENNIYSSQHEFKVLYLGGVKKIKGFKTVVNCLPYLNKNVKILFAGNMVKYNKANSIKTKLINFIKIIYKPHVYYFLRKMLKHNNVKIIGLTKEPLKWIGESDILITPFKDPHFSRPAIEAMAYSKPVIGSSVEGMDEIIDHQKNGLIFKKNASLELSKAINYLCNNPKKIVDFGNNGRLKAEQNFSPQININKIVLLYEQLLKP